MILSTCTGAICTLSVIHKTVLFLTHELSQIKCQPLLSSMCMEEHHFIELGKQMSNDTI